MRVATPAGKGNADMSADAIETAGQQAAIVVRAFLEQRAHSYGPRAPFTDPGSLGVLGNQARRLILKGATLDLLKRAVRDYGATERANPAFLREWLNRAEVGLEIEAHLRRKAEEPRDGGLKPIARLLRGPGPAGGDARQSVGAIGSMPVDDPPAATSGRGDIAGQPAHDRPPVRSRRGDIARQVLSP